MSAVVKVLIVAVGLAWFVNWVAPKVVAEPMAADAAMEDMW